MKYLPVRNPVVACCLLGLTTFAAAQAVTALPEPLPSNQPVAQSFTFASDGPIGPGWSRPDEIARTYFHDSLPTLFTRTLTLSSDVPSHGKLSWLFTGPHAGFTIELTPSKVRLTQRFYNSTALWTGQGNYPDKIIRDDSRPFTGHARTLTVIVDSHLSVRLLLNGQELLTQACVFDVTRHQLIFAAPRNQHLTVAGALLATPPAEASIDVNAQQKHQTMLGFGGSPSIPAYAALSDEGKKQYWQTLKRYNLLLDREYPMGSELKPDLSNVDNLPDATPHYYGDNFPNGEVSSFEYGKQALALGGSVIYEMWALPKWATQAFDDQNKPVIDAWGKRIRTAAKPDEYARIVVEYCRMAKARTGAAPAIVGIQNEVEQPTEVFSQMALTLRRELVKAGFTSTKIHMADASFMYMGIDRANALQQNPAAWRTLDYTAAHEYDFQEFFANPDLYDDRLRAMHTASDGKPFLATEICINDPNYQEPSYRIAFNVGQLYQKNLTLLDAEALMYCWLLLDVEQPSFGGSRSLLVPDRMNSGLPIASSFQLRVMGAFSRHILKGMTRITATPSNPDLLTSAFTDGKQSTLIVVNRSTSPQRLNLNWPATTFTHAEHTTQYSENVDSPTAKDLLVQPGEILTLYN